MNDIEKCFEDNGVDSLDMINNISDDVLDSYLKLFILLYADDTVLMSESVHGMQHMLNVFSDYCDTWKLHVNFEKTKVVIFSRRRDKSKTKFIFKDKDLLMSENYNYLGVLFNFNNSFMNAKKKLCEQAQKALYSVYYKIRNINIPLDLQLKLFDTLVTPILLHGCEVTGFEKNDNIEKVHLQFLKRVLKVRSTTPNYLVYEELGRFPLMVDIKCRMLVYWNRLISSNKLSSKIATLLFRLHSDGMQGIKWIEFIKSTFEEIGLNFIFSDQIQVNTDWLKLHVRQILRDQFIQKWHAELETTSRGIFYLSFKKDFFN